MEELDSAQKPEDYEYEGPKPLDFSNPVGCPCAHTKEDLLALQSGNGAVEYIRIYVHICYILCNAGWVNVYSL